LQELPLIVPPYVFVDLQGGTFAGQIDGENIVAMTTLQAPHGRIVVFATGSQTPTDWLTLVPDSARRISSFEVLDNLIVVHYHASADLVTEIFSKDGTFLREIQYPSSGTCRLGRVDTAAHRIFYEHSDSHKPPAIYEVDLQTCEHSSWWRQTVPGLGQEPLVEKHLYPALDGTPVPMTIVRKPEIPKTSPVLLTAYGGGGAKASPSFSILVTVLLEMGFACATAHIRGGGEGGTDWHASALKRKKQTSVDDLLAGAEWLLSNGYSTKEHLGCAGQSHGALMVLCATTQRPELFRAVMALGPIADLTRFHLFGVGRSFVTEFGDPNDADDFEALYRLSPYHRVNSDVEYPAVLIISGDRDKRCDSLHARKMIARLREVAKTQGPVLLDYLEERGHKPVLPLPVRIQSLADRLTFLISELGTTEGLRGGR
jgi:prolyl oligopeptidase